MAKDLTRAEIKGILEKGSFNELVGATENEQIDFKGAPYYLDTNLKKQELSKDVSGFANTKGGIILLGVLTEKKATHQAEEVVKIRPYDQGIVEIQQYYDIIRSWIYPKVQEVIVKWYREISDPTKGIVAIIVPHQGEPRKLFLINGNVDDAGKHSRVVFGYAERQQANTLPLKIDEIHSLIIEGTKNREIQQQNENILGMLQDIKTNFEIGRETISPINIDELLDLRVSEALEAVGLMQSPAFILSAVPLPLVEIPALFTSRDSEVVQLLENPPELRSSGFGIKSGNDARIVRGKLRRAVSSGYKVLDLWRDGVLIFAATGDSEFLSWGTKLNGPLRINQLALIESTYLFAQLVSKVFQHFQPLARKLNWEMRLLNMTVGGLGCGLIQADLEHSLGSMERTFITHRARI